VIDSPVIFLMGPTASGKTNLAFAIADDIPCEIISVDSVMVYKGLDIGSAKPDTDTLKKYPHHLVDILDPSESYSVASFRDDAMRIIKESHSKGKVPLLVGGTMLYFSSLLRGLSKMPSANPEIRKNISDLADKKGWEFVHTQLAEVDPSAAERIHPNDPQRIQRAMEVYELTGISLSEWHEKSAQDVLPFTSLKLALIPDDRARLHGLIEQRFDQMLNEGFLEEARELYQNENLHVDLPSMRSVGYRQAWEHFSGGYDQAMMREKAIIATRQLAKRQLTWLRSEPDLCDISAENCDIHDVCQQIHSYLA